MRKLIYGINLTIDGCCDHTKGIADEEIHEHFTQLMRECDVLVYGRKTYELMVPFWPDMAKNGSAATKAMADFAEAFSSVNRIVVVSRSLEKVEAKNTTIVRGDLKDEILKLKQEEGKGISTGGVDVPSQLIALGLVDEYYIVIHPTLAGEGRRLLTDLTLQESPKLKLVESKVFKSGAVALHYLKQ